MPDRTHFFSRAEAMMRHYSAGDYAGALRVTEQLARDFPQEQATTALWRLCLLSRMGRTQQALDAMSLALQGGLWWTERSLRDDEDLKPMQGLPAYEAMVAECKRRYNEAQKGVRPEVIVRMPAAQPPYPLLVALHGRQGTAEGDLPRWEPVVSHGWMLAMLQSSQLGSPEAFCWDDTERARDEITAQYRSLAEQYPLDAGRIVLGGFSQGAALSIQLALRGPIPVRGFIAVVPGGMALQGLEGLAQSARRLRGYLVAGGRDPRHDSFLQIRDTLNRNGIPCELEEHPDRAHEFPPGFDRTIDNALRFLFA